MSKGSGSLFTNCDVINIIKIGNEYLITYKDLINNEIFSNKVNALIMATGRFGNMYL